MRSKKMRGWVWQHWGWVSSWRVVEVSIWWCRVRKGGSKEWACRPYHWMWGSKTWRTRKAIHSSCCCGQKWMLVSGKKIIIDMYIFCLFRSYMQKPNKKPRQTYFSEAMYYCKIQIPSSFDQTRERHCITKHLILVAIRKHHELLP